MSKRHGDEGTEIDRMSESEIMSWGEKLEESKTRRITESLELMKKDSRYILEIGNA